MYVAPDRGFVKFTTRDRDEEGYTAIIVYVCHLRRCHFLLEAPASLLAVYVFSVTVETLISGSIPVSHVIIVILHRTHLCIWMWCHVVLVLVHISRIEMLSSLLCLHDIYMPDSVNMVYKLNKLIYKSYIVDYIITAPKIRCMLGVALFG
jgi:hypothetical protein